MSTWLERFLFLLQLFKIDSRDFSQLSHEISFQKDLVLGITDFKDPAVFAFPFEVK